MFKLTLPFRPVLVEVSFKGNFSEQSFFSAMSYGDNISSGIDHQNGELLRILSVERFMAM